MALAASLSESADVSLSEASSATGPAIRRPQAQQSALLKTDPTALEADSQPCAQDGVGSPAGHILVLNSTDRSPAVVTHTGGPPVLAGCQTQPEVAGSGPSGSRMFDSPQTPPLAFCRRRVASPASPDSGRTVCPRSPSPLALSPMNDEELLSAVSAEEVENAVSYTHLTLPTKRIV